MKQVKHGPKVNIKNWDLNAVRNLNESLSSAFMGAVNEAVVFAAEYNTYAYFPFDYCFHGDDGINGPPVKDPSIIRVSIPLGDEFSEPMWDISLKDIVKEALEDGMTKEGKINSNDTGAIRLAVALRQMFRELADSIDDVLPRNVVESDR
jgi:hypothetical protein